MKKRIIALLLTAVLAVGTAATALAGTFPDVSGDYWGSGDIERAVSLGLVNGFDDGTYRPEAQVSYAEFCAMLSRLLFGAGYVPGGTGSWYDEYIALCLQKGVLDGTPFLRNWDPNAAVPRVELARMIENALTAAGVPAVTRAEREEAAGRIGDIGRYSAADASAIEAVYAMGILYGEDPQGNFNGERPMTRAQAAAVLLRIYDFRAAREETPEEPGGLPLDPRSVYERMTAMKARYPEGTPWTNANSYEWHAIPGVLYTGYGCAGFAFLLSDAAFGDLPARQVSPVRFEDVRPGDILRINGDTHSVIVLQVLSDGVVIAEGNYNSSVHWGRKLTSAQVDKADYMFTRYPE